MGNIQNVKKYAFYIKTIKIEIRWFDIIYILIPDGLVSAIIRKRFAKLKPER